MLFRPKMFFFIFCFFFSLLVIWPIFVPFCIGVTLAYVSEQPFYFLNNLKILSRLKNYFLLRKIPIGWVSWILAIFFMILVLLGILTPLVLATYLTLQEIVHLLDGQETQAFSDFLRNKSQLMSDYLGDYGVVFSASELLDRVKEVLSTLGRQILREGAQLATSAPQMTLDTVVVVLTWVVFLVRGKNLRSQALPILIPWKEQRIILCKTTGDVVKALIIANIIVSVLQSVVATAILGLAGIPRCFLWGFLAFFLSFVPIVGTAPIMIGGSLYAFFHGKPVSGIVVFIGAIVVAMVDNVLRPFLMKSSGSLSFFWLFTALVGGIAQFGLLGAVLGPLAFSLCLAAYNGYASKSGDSIEEPV